MKHLNIPFNIDSSGVGGSIKNLSTIANLSKSMKLNLIKSTKSDLTKVKKRDFAKTKSSETDFFTLKVKKTFIYLWKTFIKALISRYSNLEPDTLGYIIGRVLNKMTLD